LRKVVIFVPALVVVAAFILYREPLVKFITVRSTGAPALIFEASTAPISSRPAGGKSAPIVDENEKLLEDGRQAAKAGDTAMAQAAFVDLMRRFPSSDIGGRAAVEMGLMYKAGGDLFSERGTLSDALKGLDEGALRREVVAELNRINGELVFSKKPTTDSIVYSVKKGDSLFKIAGQYKITPEFIRRVNYMSSDRLNVGEKLKVFQGPFDAVIEKAKFRLTVYRAGVFIKEYGIGIGKNGSTPEGEFYVQNKLVDPTWDPPGPEFSPSKAPDNPLGTRWIGFQKEYGVHGTIEPQSIGKAESRGCVRLLNADVEELYDIVTIGSKVVVKP
jgi:LysM repeat protein